jgi:hypothetical protein
VRHALRRAHDWHTIRQAVLATGQVTTLLGVPCSPDCLVNPRNGGCAEGTGAAAAFASPFDIVFHYPTGSLFIVDSANFLIRRVR